jgi:hypothetical protein
MMIKEIINKYQDKEKLEHHFPSLICYLNAFVSINPCERPTADKFIQELNSELSNFITEESLRLGK